MTYEPTYTLFTDFTDGLGDYSSFATWDDAKRAMKAAEHDPKTLYAWLKFYPDVEDDFTVAEWSSPSIFNLSK